MGQKFQFIIAKCSSTIPVAAAAGAEAVVVAGLDEDLAVDGFGVLGVAVLLLVEEVPDVALGLTELEGLKSGEL